MLVKALRSFAGPSLSMKRDEIRDLKSDEAKSLIRAGHVEKVEKKSSATEAKLPEGEVAENDNKSGNAE